MKIAIRLLALGLLLALSAPPAAHAGRGRPSGFSFWIGKTDSGIQTGAATRFYLANAPETGDAGTTEALREFPMPTSGTLSELRVSLSADVDAAGDSLVVTVRKNGADTRLACSIVGSTGTEMYCENVGDEAVFARGDRVSLQFVTAGSPAAVLPGWSLRFDPDATSEGILPAITTIALAGNSDSWWGLGCGTVVNGSDVTRQLAMPIAGRIVAMYVRSSGVIASGNRSVDLYKNGVASTEMTCTLNNAAQDCSDVIGQIVLNPGDTLTAHAVSADAATLQGVNIGLLLIPYNPGEFALLTGASPSVSATNYMYMNSAGSGLATATEATAAGYLPPLLLLRAFALVSVAPGTGASWRFGIRRDLTTDTALGCTIADPATNCSVAYAIGTELNQRIAWSSVPSAVAPAAARAMLSLAVKAR